jgi:hypothetical protein
MKVFERVKEPREIKTYKCADSVYKRALKNAKKSGSNLAEEIEKLVYKIAERK